MICQIFLIAAFIHRSNQPNLIFQVPLQQPHLPLPLPLLLRPCSALLAAAQPPSAAFGGSLGAAAAAAAEADTKLRSAEEGKSRTEEGEDDGRAEEEHEATAPAGAEPGDQHGGGGRHTVVVDYICLWPQAEWGRKEAYYFIMECPCDFMNR